MPKVNVYLPDDMAAEVRAAKLSLSPICQQAIRKELDKLNAHKEATRSIEKVAARLRGTLSEEDARKRQEGHADGVAWAQDWATASELRSIANDWEPGRGGDIQKHSLVNFTADKYGQDVASVRHEEGDPYWLGFIEGSSEVLAQVEPLL